VVGFWESGDVVGRGVAESGDVVGRGVTESGDAVAAATGGGYGLDASGDLSGEFDAAVGGFVLAEPEEQPLLAPVSPNMSFSGVHALTQTRLREPRGPDDVQEIAIIRRSATIRRGTRMIKLLSSRQFSAYLHGRLPGGFCYRAFDLTSLHGPGPLNMLTGDANSVERANNQVVFALRWRAVDPVDYHIPFSLPVGDLPAYRGLSTISPHNRLGPPVLGTGFAPSSQYLVPEFVTADMADLPMPAGATLVAFTPEGLEIGLYLYLPEQRAWTRMFGPQWRHLVASMPEVPPDQEYVPMTMDRSAMSTLVGHYNGELYEALADPPHEFRVLARARAARYPVQTLARRTRYVNYRGAECTVIRAEGDWVRLRLCRPDSESTPTLGAQPIERGLYELWAQATELTVREVDTPYAI
jgi:hypothetical protein